MAEKTESVNAAPLPLDIGIFAHNEAGSIAVLIAEKREIKKEKPERTKR